MASTISRRGFLASGVAATGALLFSPAFLRDVLAASAVAGEGPYGPLQPPNEWGLMLPQGFTGRQIARGGKPLGTYPWHFATDGSSTFRTQAGGHIVVANSEAPSALGGGSSAIRFAPDGSIERAYRVLAGTNLNCAGGPTPWGSWLSCEEHEGGMVWEADPAGVLPARPRPALGNFSHEAAAVDPARGHVYLTEDQPDACFYRFTPDASPDLSSGLLEAAVVGADQGVQWVAVPDPNLVTQAKPVRQQVPQATRFNGGEGLWHHNGVIYFTTKGDKTVWAYDAAAQTLDVLYRHADAPDAALDAVDNVTVSAYGDVYVCEDGGNMEICLIAPDRIVSPFCRLGRPDGSIDPDHEGSEMVGVGFDPSGTRMYFGSQRAYPYAVGTPAADGALYEVTGPFRLPPDWSADQWPFGPPIGETGALAEDPNGLSIDVADRFRVGLDGNGLRVRVKLDRGAPVHVAVRTADLHSEASGNATYDRPLPVTLATLSRQLGAGASDIAVGLAAGAVSQLLAAGSLTAIVTVVAIDSSGRQRTTARRTQLRI